MKLNQILYYAITTVFYDNLMAISRQGKSYSTLNEDDLASLKFNKYLIDSLESNNTNIFHSQIQEFLIINIPLQRQQKIVDEIKSELDKQEELKQEITHQRNEIDELITNSLTMCD